jgi:hypothetical protein
METELYNNLQFSTPNKYPGDQIKKNEMGRAEHVARVGERRGTYRILVGQLQGKRLLGRQRH